MNFARAHDQYLTPLDEPEAVLCEDCGEEMIEIDGSRDIKCVNQFCPSKFEGSAKELAYQLIGVREEVKSLASKIRRLSIDKSKG